MHTDQKIKSYTGVRRKIIDIIPRIPLRVLDIGCSNGTNGFAIMQAYPDSKVYGVERDQAFANIAREKLTDVIEADLNSFSTKELPKNIDLLIFADVLEHLTDPRSTLKRIIENSATENANIVISLPNIQHVTAIKNLFIGNWPQRERGLFDKTHLHWFTLKSIRQLATDFDFEIRSIERSYRILDKPGGIFNRLSNIFNYTPLRNYFTYQYIVLLERKNETINNK